MCRFTAALALFFAAGKLMYRLTGLQPNPDLEPDFVTKLMWTSDLTWGLLVITGALTVIFYIASARSLLGMPPAPHCGAGKRAVS